MQKEGSMWRDIPLLLAILACFFALFFRDVPSAVSQVPTASIPVKYDSAASTNATRVKATAGAVDQVTLINTTTTLYYLKFYDKGSAVPTCNSDTVRHKVPVPYGTSNSGGGAVVPFPLGIRFNLGIGFCLTGGLADSDNSNAATGVVINVAFR